MCTKLDQFETRFGKLCENFRSELKRRIDVTTTDILLKLTSLSLVLRPEYEAPVQELIPALKTVCSSDEIFIHINPMMTYIDYRLLHFLINSFGSDSIRHDMNVYVSEINCFFRETTLTQIMNADNLLGRNFQEISDILIEYDKNPDLVTIADLNKLRLDVCSQFRLSHCMFTLKSLRKRRSFLVVWSFHSAFLEHITKSTKLVDQKFYKEQGILFLSVNENQMYPPKV